MKFGRLLMGFLLLAALVAIAPVAVAQVHDGDPLNPDPGTGGPGGGDPCQSSQNGYCESMTIYPGGYECQARWCAPDPSAWSKCASYNSLTCQQGYDAGGDPVFVWINDCALCAN